MMQVSFRIKNLKSGEASGALAHDFRRKVPNYVDRSETSRNAILDGGPPDIPASIRDQGERVKARTGKKIRKDANLFLSGILTFSKDARGLVNATPPDQRAREFARQFAEKNRVKLLYLIRHSDETTVHYHFMTENISSEGESAKNKLSPPVLSKWQDVAGQVFSPVGIGRGTPKVERIAAGEPMSAVIHRSVRKLHEDLPREIAQEEDRLRDVAERRISLESDFQETIRDEAKTLPPFPEEEDAEVITEQSFFGGTKTRTVKVFRAKSVKKFLDNIAPTLAAAKLFEREVVPREDFMNLRRERDGLAGQLDESERKRADLEGSVSSLEATLEKALKFVAWIKSGFPDIFSRYLSSLRSPVAPEEKGNVAGFDKNSGEPDDDSVAPK
jgi:hypothetical protein